MAPVQVQILLSLLVLFLIQVQVLVMVLVQYLVLVLLVWRLKGSPVGGSDEAEQTDKFCKYSAFMTGKGTQLVTAANLKRRLLLGSSDVELVLTAAGGQSGGSSLHPAVPRLITLNTSHQP